MSFAISRLRSFIAPTPLPNLLSSRVKRSKGDNSSVICWRFCAAVALVDWRLRNGLSCILENPFLLRFYYTESNEFGNFWCILC